MNGMFRKEEKPGIEWLECASLIFEIGLSMSLLYMAFCFILSL